MATDTDTDTATATDTAAAAAAARRPTGRLTLPYYAPSATLPAPLPSIAEILATETVLPCIFHKRAVRRVGEHFIVKHGAISLDEAENMYFVAEQCGGGGGSGGELLGAGAVGGEDTAQYKQMNNNNNNNNNNSKNIMLVPTLYAAFHDAQTDSNFIIMEYIPGQSLESRWDDLGRAGRARVAQHLNAQFAALRSIVPGREVGGGSTIHAHNHNHNHNHNNTTKKNKNENKKEEGEKDNSSMSSSSNSTGPYYGRLGRRPYNDIFLGSSSSSSSSSSSILPCGGGGSSSSSSSGPFTTEPQLNEAFYQRYAALHAGLAPGRGAYYRERVFPRILANHPPVFTHGDLQAKNILVREADGVPVVIDWECAAWYPSYWEYTNALWTSRRWDDEWWVFVGEVLRKEVGDGDGGSETGGGEFVVEFKCLENLLGDLLDAPQPGV